MKLWDELLKVNLNDKEVYIKSFSELVKSIKEEKFEFKEGIFDEGKYYLINETNRGGSYFVNIVPKEICNLFKKMQKEIPNQPLGFTVLAGKVDDKELRVCCFGIPCGMAGKSLK